MSTNSFGYVPQLDGIRALAIILVLAAHLGLGTIVPGGFGVTVFFFLSGYLITSLLRSELESSGRISLGGFYMRRLVRICPPLYLTMIFGLGLFLVGALTSPLDMRVVLMQALYIENYREFFNVGRGVPMPLWSLAIEEHFYLVFPALFIFLTKRTSLRAVAAWCAALCLVALAVRLIPVAVQSEFLLRENYHMTQARMDSILFGCILALWQNPVLDKNAWRPALWHVAAAGMILIVCLLFRDEQFRQTFRYTFQGMALFVLFSAALHNRGPVAALLSSKVAKWIGAISYTAYLVHYIFITALAQLAPNLPTPIMATLVLALTVLYSVLMREFVERPLSSLRRKGLVPSGRTATNPT